MSGPSARSLRNAAWWLFLMVGMESAPALSAVEPTNFVVSVPIENLIQNPADLFDLEGKTVRFTPSGDGSYRVETIARSTLVPCTKPLRPRNAQGPRRTEGWELAIPFSFSFGGKQWHELFVNRDGDISFERPESAYANERNPWADGGMGSVAGAIDSRSMAGMEKTIAVFWGPYQSPNGGKISTEVNSNCVAVTWNMTRVARGQAVLGVNTFQARLYPSGVIEFTYPHIAERDGIVGLFPGTLVSRKPLSHWASEDKEEHPGLDMDSADVYDMGSVLDLAITMKEDALTNVDSGSLDYRCLINHDGMKDLVSVSVSDKQSISCWLASAPLTGGWRIEGRRVDMFVSKVLLAGCQTCSVAWGATWWGKPGQFTGSGENLTPFDLSRVSPGTVKLSAAHEEHQGNIFEVFHYPVITRSSERLLKTIYQKLPANDDIAIVFTDFRIDDLFGQGPGAIAANFGIEGIGQGTDHPRSTKEIGSTQLQMSISPVWLGAPMFNETGRPGEYGWFNFAQGVKWIAHECTHRWGMDVSFVNPATGKQEKLTDSSGHWDQGVDTAAMFPVSDMFLAQKSGGKSIMGGQRWTQNSENSFSKDSYPSAVPGGYSALDLYIMGMLPPERVPPTLFLKNLKNAGRNRFEATPIHVQISDIVAAMGTRKPSSAEAQKVFQMKFYIVHEPGRDADPAMMERAQKLSVTLADFFSRATGGVMTVVPSSSAAAEKKSTVQKRGGRRARRQRLNTPGT